MPIVTLLTDFGTSDSYVAEVKAVLLSRSPVIQIIDITHDITPYSIEEGAFQLLRAYYRFPSGTLHLAVVDPGVGSQRRCLYVRTRDFHFVGPDNGLLLWAIRDAEAREGQKASVYEIPVPPGVGPTFHGRDLFAPFAATALHQRQLNLTPAIKLEGREFPVPEKGTKGWKGEIVAIDHYGNLISNIPLERLESPTARIGRRFGIKTYDNYQCIPRNQVACIRGSHGFWEISTNLGSAAKKLRAKIGDPITLS